MLISSSIEERISVALLAKLFCGDIFSIHRILLKWTAVILENLLESLKSVVECCASFGTPQAIFLILLGSITVGTLFENPLFSFITIIIKHSLFVMKHAYRLGTMFIWKNSSATCEWRVRSRKQSNNNLVERSRFFWWEVMYHSGGIDFRLNCIFLERRH